MRRPISKRYKLARQAEEIAKQSGVMIALHKELGMLEEHVLENLLVLLDAISGGQGLEMSPPDGITVLWSPVKGEPVMIVDCQHSESGGCNLSGRTRPCPMYLGCQAASNEYTGPRYYDRFRSMQTLREMIRDEHSEF